MRKLLAMTVVLLWVLCTITGCYSISGYPSEVEERVLEKAEEYLLNKYEGLRLDSSVSSVYTVNNSLAVHFRSEDGQSFMVYNALYSPYDNYECALYGDDAEQFIEEAVEAALGDSVSVKFAEIAYFSTMADAPLSGLSEYLSKYGTAVFGVALVANEEEFDDIVGTVISVCEEAGINQPFGLFFYEKERTITLDFKMDKAMQGRGDFINWTFVSDVTAPVLYNGSGTAYRGV